MEYRNLGRSGLKVSPLCLGAMMFGGETSEADSRAIIAAAREIGVNFIDTADAYNGGASERVVGAAIRAERDHWVLASKIANPMGAGPNQRGLSRRWVLQGVENSLSRLGTDHIDILYLHKEDHATPLEETVSALAELLRQGRIRYFGVSNYRSWRIARLCHLCDQAGIGRPIVSQPLYNLLNRQAETEQIPVAEAYGLGIVPYSPLARGVLTGKYAPGAAPEAGSRAARQDRRLMQTEWREESLALVQRLGEHAAARGTTTATLALQWVLANRAVPALIAGPRTMAQWQGYVAALDFAYGPEDEAFLSAQVPTGHSSTPGYNDPAYPIEGRALRAGL